MRSFFFVGAKEDASRPEQVAHPRHSLPPSIPLNFLLNSAISIVASFQLILHHHNYRLVLSFRRSSVKLATQAKLEQAKEMKAKASAYADAASPVKRPGGTKSPELAASRKVLPAPSPLPKSSIRLTSSTQAYTLLFVCKCS
jgi:hypothetical protein